MLIRRATSDDAVAMADAHLDSIRSLGPAVYSDEQVAIWASNVRPAMYLGAMATGEVFFVAIGEVDGRPGVLGFSSHHFTDSEHGVSVYVRGSEARRGLGTQLLAMAEQHARESGAASIQIEASLPGVAFYEANGFVATGREEVWSMPVVLMSKRLV